MAFTLRESLMGRLGSVASEVLTFTDKFSWSAVQDFAGGITTVAATFTGTITAVAANFSGALRTTSATAPLGYGTGAGSATVTQATDRTTGVAITTVTGSITTHNASLAAEAAAEFTVTATGLVTVNDVVILSIRSGTNGGNTLAIVSTVANDSFKIKVCNNNAAGGTAETGAIIINYAVVKGAAS